ncbi:MAG TPA: hypothetical protein PK198_22315 [Saprospiraceae bacterium]|nr:hypothetical protein [Saprospiraceae bacterium]HRK83355.1 hypothetical protein [Saprospiraceae bacterium]
MLTLATARILVISPTDTDSWEMRIFISRMPFENVFERDYVVRQMVPTDEYDFAIFDARKLPKIFENTVLNTEDESYLKLFRQYLKMPLRYIVFFGEFLHDLDRERCPSANSKFTLYARIRELIEFINAYRER